MRTLFEIACIPKDVFDSPWVVVQTEDEDGNVVFNVCDNLFAPVAQHCIKHDAHRIARIPELYQELKEITFEHCSKCVKERGELERSVDEFIDNGCPFCICDCEKENNWKTLKFVRKGI